MHQRHEKKQCKDIGKRELRGVTQAGDGIRRYFPPSPGKVDMTGVGHVWGLKVEGGNTLR